MVAWRVGSLAFRSERKRQWQDMQRKAEDANFSLLDKEEAIQAKTAEVLFCSSAQQFLSLIVKQWRRLAFKEKRSREVELLRQRSQVRLQEQQRRLEQAQLATVRYRNHAFASCFATSAVGSTNWLRLFLWDWRRAVTSSTSIKILRLWYIVAAMEIFKCKHWLLEFCLRLWSALVRIPLMKKAQSQLQPILVLHEEASIEARIVAGESFLLQYIVICAWRRFLWAELLKLEVKHVCHQWNTEELNLARALHRVQNRVGTIWAWADLSMRKLHAREDLCDALLAWAQETRCSSEEARLRKAFEEAQMGPELQRRFEGIVCARWRERSLRLHHREDQHSCLVSTFLWWRMAALHEGVTRRRRRSRQRAVTLAEQWTGSCHLQTQRLVFDSWQTLLCSARQRWLDRRRAWLEQMLEGHFPGAASPSSVPQLPDQVHQHPFSTSLASPSSGPQLPDQVHQHPFSTSLASPSSVPQLPDQVHQQPFSTSLASPSSGPQLPDQVHQHPFSTSLASPSSGPQLPDQVHQQPFSTSLLVWLQEIEASPSSVPQLPDQVHQQPFSTSLASPSSGPQLPDQVHQQPLPTSPVKQASASQLIDTEFAAKLQQFTFGLKLGSLESLQSSN
ncbi:unnamed protein product [Cladocopium goreaui]|uniref:Sfi1 spindle body domain-containing protein n=1 Tax=Cladocopium goreaui TaxID=2562237 RepID=A0A9P1GKH8_9DINO|nr:unnamed protein product [Cladocopium goreaui]